RAWRMGPLFVILLPSKKGPLVVVRLSLTTQVSEIRLPVLLRWRITRLDLTIRPTGRMRSLLMSRATTTPPRVHLGCKTALTETRIQATELLRLLLTQPATETQPSVILRSLATLPAPTTLELAVLPAIILRLPTMLLPSALVLRT